MIRIAGGRNTIVFTTALLIIPTAGAGFALSDPTTPLWVFQLLALLSGIGGGNFASSMSNISGFYPKSQQGLALGLNAGLGNFGVTTMQILIPLVMTMGIFGGFVHASAQRQRYVNWQIAAGSETWVQNAGWIWLVFLLPLTFIGWFRMNNIIPISQRLARCSVRRARFWACTALASFTAALGLYLYLPAPVGLACSICGLPCSLLWARWAYCVCVLRQYQTQYQAPIQYFQRQAHLVDERALHHHLRLFIGFSMALPWPLP